MQHIQKKSHNVKSQRNFNASSEASVMLTVINRNIIKPSSVVRDLGVLFDAELSMRQHVLHVSQTSAPARLTCVTDVCASTSHVCHRPLHQHVSHVSQTCFFHLRRIRSVRRQLGCNVTAKMVTILVLSRLDHCNAVHAGLPEMVLAPLQTVLHAAAVRLLW